MSETFRGHVRDTPAFPASEQEATLIEAGVPKRAIYRDDLKGAIRSCRKGNRLVVAGFRGLAETRAEMLEAVDDTHARGAVIMDAKTKRLSSNKSQRDKLVAEGVADIANEKRGPRKNGHKGHMPWDQIAALWFDKTLKTERVMALVNQGRRGSAKLSHTTIWRRLKKRDAITGRPSNR